MQWLSRANSSALSGMRVTLRAKGSNPGAAPMSPFGAVFRQRGFHRVKQNVVIRVGVFVVKRQGKPG